VTSLPTVASVSFNRAFPHTLVVVVVPERAVAVVRQGADSWLVSARGRVISRLAHGALASLPRIWTGRGPTFSVGSPVDATLAPALAAVSPLAAIRFPARVSAVRTTGGELVLELRSGIEVRLGQAHDIALKLAVAANVLPLVDSSTRYVDVSVPERPVSGTVLTPVPAAAAAPASGPRATGSPTLNSQPKGKVRVSTGP
jgi:cell division septal protein FtsQ